MDHLAVAVDVFHTQLYSFQQAQSAGIDRIQAHLIFKTMYTIQYPLHFRRAENNWQFLFPLWTDELQRMPFLFQCLFIEKLDPA